MFAGAADAENFLHSDHIPDVKHETGAEFIGSGRKMPVPIQKNVFILFTVGILVEKHWPELPLHVIVWQDFLRHYRIGSG